MLHTVVVLTLYLLAIFGMLQPLPLSNLMAPTGWVFSLEVRGREKCFSIVSNFCSQLEHFRTRRMVTPLPDRCRREFTTEVAPPQRQGIEATLVSLPCTGNNPKHVAGGLPEAFRKRFI